MRRVVELTLVEFRRRLRLDVSQLLSGEEAVITLADRVCALLPMSAFLLLLQTSSQPQFAEDHLAGEPLVKDWRRWKD